MVDGRCLLPKMSNYCHVTAKSSRSILHKVRKHHSLSPLSMMRDAKQNWAYNNKWSCLCGSRTTTTMVWYYYHHHLQFQPGGMVWYHKWYRKVWWHQWLCHTIWSYGGVWCVVWYGMVHTIRTIPLVSLSYRFYQEWGMRCVP
jgi:hypothetical protein